MRLYKIGMDRILVEDANSGKYVDINDYLNKIPNGADRLIEKGEILKAVKWYD